MELALGRFKSCPFDEVEIRGLKNEVLRCLTGSVLELRREEGDR